MSDQIRIPCVIMRAGTSKGIFLKENDLPADQNLRDKVILRIFGSPDVRQIDGLAGADPLTSKLAIIGPSGSGKSTAMLAVMGLLDHKAAVEAEKVSLFGNTVRAGDNAAIIFQDPLKCLNPTVKIGRQIAETVRNRKKCTWRESKKRSEELLDSVGIRHPRLRMKQYPFELSGGMRQRVVIAIALACEPNLIVADEPTTALDAAMQVRVIRLLKKIVKETNTALLLVSHNMGVIAAACDYVYVMKDGKMIENGCADDIFYNPQTEYTKKLLSDATAEQLLVKEKVFAAQENPLFTVRHLKKRFQNEEGVNDVSFDICEGEVFALAGESGSGKTTLFHLLSRLWEPSAGQFFLQGTSYTSLTRPAVRRHAPARSTCAPGARPRVGPPDVRAGPAGAVRRHPGSQNQSNRIPGARSVRAVRYWQTRRPAPSRWSGCGP